MVRTEAGDKGKNQWHQRQRAMLTSNCLQAKQPTWCNHDNQTIRPTYFATDTSVPGQDRAGRCPTPSWTPILNAKGGGNVESQDEHSSKGSLCNPNTDDAKYPRHHTKTTVTENMPLTKPSRTDGGTKANGPTSRGFS